MGTLITRHGTFDSSLANDVWSEDDEDGGSRRSQTDVHSAEGDTSISPTGASASEQPETSADTTERSALESVTPTVITPVASSRSVTAMTRTPSPSAVSAKQKSTGRPKRAKSPSAVAKPSYASPDGAPLLRDPTRALEDATEMARNKSKNTASNRLGGCDLRVMRDHLDDLTGRPSSSGAKRAAPNSSSSGATYATNKHVCAKTRLDQLRKEMEEAEEKQVSARTDMMQVFVFMREDADRRAEIEDRRRREDREALLASEKREREEREAIRLEVAAAAEARRNQEMERSRVIFEEQRRKEAELSAESRRRYEERLERDRAEARERHGQMMLLIASIQRSGPKTP
ncbi:hypothetical protein PR001_g16454 [Phytophthora rubi]|uniref:Uncharacterized protein n=1 Tax=Phytophthora rubi TaxID=129364 RepID=A0A6A3KN33_9STRA|nr:hypothetical protein PR002_g16843 [Phytophthora rubi]KAE9009414.1 hypothetical protein PR001_g16454 [Phytophthora rubi]